MTRTLVPLLIVAAMILAGCGKKPLEGSSAQLVGGWVPAETSCDSDGGIVYLKDGTWAAYDQSGTWALKNGRLTLEITERGGTDAPGRPVKGEKPVVSTILSVSKTALVERGDDGKILTLKRCKG
jgi:hypothetical protein